MFLSLLLAGLALQPQDHVLPEAKVVADRGAVVSRSDTLSIQTHQDAASLLTSLPALYVGDYGSAAGLKTVSLRGLGSAHTAIYLDGVRVNNFQSGQADLGMMDFSDLSSVVVDYAQNSVSFLTAKPFFQGRPFAGTFRLDGGSFGTWQPYGKLAFKAGDNWTVAAHAGGILTGGAFPLPDGSLRANNDLKQLQTGADVWGTLSGGHLHAKIFYNGANRGTPGSISYPSADRQQDYNFGAQMTLKKTFSPLYTLHMSAKGAYDKLYYQSEWGDSDYRQSDFQLNSAHRFHLAPRWEVTLAADLAFGKLSSTLYQQQRWGTVIAASSAYRGKRLQANLALEYSGTFDKGVTPWHRLSPSAEIKLALAPGLDLVAFGRRAFRTPTFNELYYPGYGNTALRPEDAWLSDAGIQWHRSAGPWTLNARLDGFYSFVKDKIISVPTADPYVWTVQNVGRAQSVGADALAQVQYKAAEWLIGCSLRYGYQQARDKDSGEALPYLAAHSLTLNPSAAWKGWSLEAVWTLRAGRKDAAGDMPDWNTLDAHFGKEFSLGKAGALGLKITGRNLLNQRYEAVSGYPMPGRSLLAGLQYRF